jgi:hypothetical protein
VTWFNHPDDFGGKQASGGRTVADPFEMRVELGKVREFARATGSSHPDHLDGEHPVSPATFLMSAAFWQRRSSSAWPADRDMSRVLHGGQEFVFPDGPPEAGTVLTGQARIGEVFTKQGKRGGTMTFTEVITEYRDAKGTLVATAVGTFIETSKPTGAQ